MTGYLYWSLLSVQAVNGQGLGIGFGNVVAVDGETHVTQTEIGQSLVAEDNSVSAVSELSRIDLVR